MNKKTAKKRYSGVLMASLLYFSLPDNLKKKMQGFLTTEDMDKILAYSKNTPEPGIFLHMLKMLRKTSGRKSYSIGNAFSFIYLAVHIIFLIFSLVYEHHYLAGAALLYGLGGFLFFQRETDTYIRLRFIPRPFHFRYLVITILAYPVVMLPLGYYSAGAKSIEDNLLLIQASLLAPVFEEIFFREVLFKMLHDFIKNEYWIITTTAIFFGLVHLSALTNAGDLLPEFIMYFSAGLILGAIRWVSCSLFYPIILHVAVNTTIFYL